MSDIAPEAISRLFHKFSLIWGAQKVSSMIPPADMDAAVQIWAGSLSRYSSQTLRVVVDTLPTLGRDWPPSLAEFLDLCRQFNRPEQALALAAPRQEATPEQLEAFKQAGGVPIFNGDPLHWAKYPSSAEAIRTMVRGAEAGSHQLKDILQQHLSNPESVPVRGRNGSDAISLLRTMANEIQAAG